MPQIFLQSYAYASAAVPLTPAGERLVIASISFSLLSLLRSICGLLASWRKIRFTFQRVNGNLEAEVFNACLHECADAAERTGDRCSFKFKDGDSSDLVMLQELRLVAGQHRGGHDDLAFQLAPEAVTRSNLSFGDLEDSPPPPLPPRSPERPPRNVTPEPPGIALV